MLVAEALAAFFGAFAALGFAGDLAFFGEAALGLAAFGAFAFFFAGDFATFGLAAALDFPALAAFGAFAFAMVKC